MNTRQFAEELYDFLKDNDPNGYYNDSSTPEECIAELEDYLSDIETVKETIKDIEEIADTFDDHEVYISTVKPLLKGLRQIQEDLQAKANIRMVSDTGYEVKQSMRIGGKEVLLAENPKAEDGMIYLISNYREQGIIVEYYQVIKCDDYLEAVQDFTGRINAEVESIRVEKDALNLPAALFTAEHCYPHSYKESIEGKVVAIRADVFSPEYRRGDMQLIYVTGGHGAKANASGRAVYCYHLNTGEHTRFERHEVLGEIKPECMPDWAKDSLARIQVEMDKPAATKEFAGNYEIIERMEVGQKVFALGHCDRAANPYGTWQGRVNSANSFDMGHYFNDYDTAKTDLQDRAAKEQERMEGKKRTDGAR
jgi:hypothetical protein